MIEQQSKPRPEAIVQYYRGKLTCHMCAGTGRLTSHVAKTFQGEVFTESHVIRRCEPCDGWGIESGNRREH